jgi:hypothetical protein
MEKKMLELYQGQPVRFTWKQLERLPHEIFDNDNSRLIIEAHENGQGLVLHLSEEEAEMLGGKLNLKKMAKKLGKQINNVPKQLGEDRSLTRIAKDIDRKHHITRQIGDKINEYDQQHNISGQVGSMIDNHDVKGLKHLAKNELSKAKTEYGKAKQQLKHHVKNIDLDQLLNNADKYIQQYEQQQHQQGQPQEADQQMEVEGGKIRWKKVGKKLGSAGMKVINYQNKVAQKIGNKLPLDQMGAVGTLVQTGLDAQDRGVQLANDIYERRKQPGGFKNQLTGALKETAKREVTNAIHNGIDGAIASAVGGSFRGNGMYGSASGGSFRGNGMKGGSFRGNGLRTPRSATNSSQYTEPEKQARLSYWSPADHNRDLSVLHPEQPGFYAYRQSNSQPNYFYRK